MHDCSHKTLEPRLQTLDSSRHRRNFHPDGLVLVQRLFKNNRMNEIFDSFATEAGRFSIIPNSIF
jgi:hypothetical protein